MKYLTLIRTIALLHQHQREVKTVERRGRIVAYVEVTLDDIAAANGLAHQVLGRSARRAGAADATPPDAARPDGERSVRAGALVAPGLSL